MAGVVQAGACAFGEKASFRFLSTLLYAISLQLLRVQLPQGGQGTLFVKLWPFFPFYYYRKRDSLLKVISYFSGLYKSTGLCSKLRCQDKLLFVLVNMKTG